VMADAPRLQEACTHVVKIQKTVDQLYSRWAELENKNT